MSDAPKPTHVGIKIGDKWIPSPLLPLDEPIPPGKFLIDLRPEDQGRLWKYLEDT